MPNAEMVLLCFAQHIRHIRLRLVQLSLCPTMTELVHKNYLTAATWSSCLRLRKAWSGQVVAGLDLICLFWSMALVSNFILLLQSYIKEFRRKRVLS